MGEKNTPVDVIKYSYKNNKTAPPASITTVGTLMWYPFYTCTAQHPGIALQSLSNYAWLPNCQVVLDRLAHNLQWALKKIQWHFAHAATSRLPLFPHVHGWTNTPAVEVDIHVAQPTERALYAIPEPTSWNKWCADNRAEPPQTRVNNEWRGFAMAQT